MMGKINLSSYFLETYKGKVHLLFVFPTWCWAVSLQRFANCAIGVLNYV